MINYGELMRAISKKQNEEQEKRWQRQEQRKKQFIGDACNALNYELLVYAVQIKEGLEQGYIVGPEPIPEYLLPYVAEYLKQKTQGMSNMVDVGDDIAICLNNGQMFPVCK